MHAKRWCKLRLAVVLTCALLLSIWVSAEPPGKTLFVVAHPDDEYYFAATVYRLAVQLNGTVDELIITDGDGGFRYSTLAEAYYKTPLTEEAIGRKELPAIRKEEALKAGRVLGIRRHFFLGQRDEHFTTDEQDGLKYGWNFTLIKARIEALVRREDYKYVFCILPRATTHGYHQAAAVLAASAISELPENLRPVVLGFDTDVSVFRPPPQVLESEKWDLTPRYAFDRTTSFGFKNALTYQIVVSWMIAEHKSQGLLQRCITKTRKSTSG
jgi:N-acetylglucosamine malate deacetylase 2